MHYQRTSAHSWSMETDLRRLHRSSRKAFLSPKGKNSRPWFLSGGKRCCSWDCLMRNEILSGEHQKGVSSIDFNVTLATFWSSVYDILSARSKHKFDHSVHLRRSPRISHFKTITKDISLSALYPRYHGNSVVGLLNESDKRNFIIIGKISN